MIQDLNLQKHFLTDLSYSLDLYEHVTEDRNKLEQGLTDSQIAAMSKDKYRAFISKFVREYALDCLSQRAIKNKNSKYRKILIGELVREKCLTDKRFIQSECELLFSIRTQMIPGIRTNFSSLYANNLSCELCSLHQDSQENLLSCVKLAGEVNIPNNIKYDDVYKC